MRTIRYAAAITTIVMSLLVAGCTKAGDDSPDPQPWRPLPVDAAARKSVDTLRALPYKAGNVEVVTKVLETAGVGVYPDDARDGAEPVRLTRWQVRNLATEAANGGGVRGATLAALAGGAEGAPPVSYLLAAWVATYPSPSAGFARALLGEHDWRRADEIVFPRVLLTLFTADALKATPTGYALRPVAYTLVKAGPCTAASTFIQNGIAAVAAALKVDTSGGGVLGFLGSIWNVAVDLAAGVVKGLAKVVGAVVVAPLVDAFAVLATIQEVTSYLVEWRLHVRPQPEDNRFGVDDEVVTGKVEVHVTDNQLPVPEIVRDCGRTFGVDLSKIGSAEGSTVSWETYSPMSMPTLATKTDADTVIDEDRSAWLTYRTGQEPAARAERGQAVTAQFKVAAVLHREDVKKGQELLDKLILDNLPAPVAGVVKDLAGTVIHAATDQLRELMYDKRASRLISITFHDEPTGTPAPGPSACDGGTVAAGRYRGTDTMDYEIAGIAAHGDWKLDVRVDDDGGLDGTLTGDLTTVDGRTQQTTAVRGTLAKPLLTTLQTVIDGHTVAGDGRAFAFPAMTGGCDGLRWDVDWLDLTTVTGVSVSGDIRLTVNARRVS